MAQLDGQHVDVPLAEIVASLSIATDLAMGQPLEFALRSCVVAVRLGEALGLDERALRTVYYQSLLRYIGCNAETSTLAALVGDELAMREGYATVDRARSSEVVSLLLRTIRKANADASTLDLAKAVARGLFGSGQVKDIFAGHCEVAQRLASRLGFGSDLIVSLGQLYERWDGKGLPQGLKGEEISPAVLVVSLAQDAVAVDRLGGVEAAVAMARKRRGSSYAPAVVDCFCGRAELLLNGVEDEPAWTTVLDLEPGARILLDDLTVDAACQTIADFADLKSTFLLGHSSGVASIAERAVRAMGLPESDARSARRAGLLHDVGRIGVSTRIWDKPGALTEREWELVRLHPYHTARVFAHSPSLSKLGDLAANHHERLDGSGYHRSLPGAMLSPVARVLAASDMRQAMSEGRPHRASLSTDDAARQLRAEARAGRLDSQVVDVVLGVTGSPKTTSRCRDDALTAREVEVLRLLARGQTTKQIGQKLFISPKTAGNHVQHIYEKIGVATRAGATLYAMEHGLLLDA